MTSAESQQVAEQRQKRECVRDAILEQLSAQPSMSKLSTNYRGITARPSQPEPESVSAVVNITQDRISCIRTVDCRGVHNGDTGWLNSMHLRCPVTRGDRMLIACFYITATVILCLNVIAGISSIRNTDGSRIVNQRIIRGWTLSTLAATAFWTVELLAIAMGAPITAAVGFVAGTCVAYITTHCVLAKMAANRMQATPACRTST